MPPKEHKNTSKLTQAHLLALSRVSNDMCLGNVQVGGWLEARNDSAADALLTYAQQLAKGIQLQLWQPDTQWFVSLWPDGSQQLVMTYHLFDAIGTPTPVLSQEQMDALVSHVRVGEFLAPNGMFSVALQDHVHWDLEVCMLLKCVYLLSDSIDRWCSLCSICLEYALILHLTDIPRYVRDRMWTGAAAGNTRACRCASPNSSSVTTTLTLHGSMYSS